MIALLLSRLQEDNEHQHRFLCSALLRRGNQSPAVGLPGPVHCVEKSQEADSAVGSRSVAVGDESAMPLPCSHEYYVAARCQRQEAKMGGPRSRYAKVPSLEL